MRKLLLVTCLAFAAISVALAQPVESNMPQITNCIALENAQIVSAPGLPPTTGTVIIRDGLITAIGPDTKVPYDAYRIAADSLFVYAAFIDAFSHTGVKKPDTDNQQNRSRPSFDEEGHPSLEDAGITPFNSVRSAFDPKEKSIAEWREQGFGIAHIFPYGRMIPGQGAILVLAGDKTDQMLWKENVSMYGQWYGARGAYPQTMIGIIAKWRELYQNSTQLLAHQNAYDNEAFVSRPDYNRAHKALIPLVKKEIPLYFKSAGVKSISRAITLQENLGMNMVIAGAEEAWYFKDKFHQEGLSLVLSLELPEDKDEKGTSKDAPDDTPPDSTSTASTDETVMVNLEKEAFEKRRAQSLLEHRQQAGVLAAEGIAFSFGTMGLKKGDFMKNLKLMLANGLDTADAHAALTTHPAKLLGIEQYCGTVEAGKMANLIVSTSPLFTDDAAIRYMIVEGKLYAYEVKEQKKVNTEENLASLSLVEGTWAYEIEAPDQTRTGTFVIKKNGDDVEGTITGQDMSASGDGELEHIVIDGKSISFTFDIELGGQMMELEFDLEVDGEDMDGTVAVGEFGSFKVTGQRTIKPE